jgi:hypothetical protein
VQEVRHIGTNALPCLLSWLSYEPSVAERKWQDLRSYLRYSLRHWLPDPGVMIRPLYPPELALCGFKILGEQANSAIPSLARQANNPSAEESKVCLAIYALRHIGPKALPEVIPLLTNHSATVRLQATFILAKFGTNALPTVPALLRCFTDTNQDVATSAITALPENYLHHNDVIAALVNSAQDPRGEVRITALGQLSRTGPHAMQILEHALEDPDLNVRIHVLHQLLQSNSMVLTNPPVFAALTNLICTPQGTRYWPVETLGTYGISVPEQAIPILTSLSQDPDKIMCATATKALAVLNLHISRGQLERVSPRE